MFECSLYHSLDKQLNFHGGLSFETKFLRVSQDMASVSVIWTLRKTNATTLKKHPVNPPVMPRRVRLAKRCSTNPVLLFNAWLAVPYELEVGTLQTTLSAVVPGAESR